MMSVMISLMASLMTSHGLPYAPLMTTQLMVQYEDGDDEEAEEEEAPSSFDRVEVYGRTSTSDPDANAAPPAATTAAEDAQLDGEMFEVVLTRHGGESLGLGIGFDDDGRVLLLSIGAGAFFNDSLMTP